MGDALKRENYRYTYADYLSWSDDEKWELIEGMPYKMVAPAQIHQDILLALSVEFYNYLKGKPCSVHIAPFDVILTKEEVENNATNVVQPDIFIVCDKNKLNGKVCIGSSDLCIEIVSPTSTSRDYVEKLNLYWKHEIKEYWIIDPIDKSVMVYILDCNNNYEKPKMYTKNDEVRVKIFENFKIDLKDIFVD